jgi:hypothetical protein
MKPDIRKIAVTAAAAAVILLFMSLHANAASMNPHCTDVGGAILSDLNGFGPNTTMGVATGDLKGGVGVEIVGINSTFTVFTVQHHWVTENGESLQIDRADASGTYVASGLFAFTDYRAHLSGGTGRFAGASGDLSFIGELDLNTGHAILRYSGHVCFAPAN